MAGSLKRPGTGGSGSSRVSALSKKRKVISRYPINAPFNFLCVQGGIALSPTRPSRTSTPLTEPPANGIVVRWSEYLDSKGKIDYEGFEKLLNELARLTYPQYRLDPLLATKAVGAKSRSPSLLTCILRLTLRCAPINCISWCLTRYWPSRRFCI